MRLSIATEKGENYLISQFLKNTPIKFTKYQ